MTNYLSFLVSIAVSSHSVVLRAPTQHSLGCQYQRFGEACCFHLQYRGGCHPHLRITAVTRIIGKKRKLDVVNSKQRLARTCLCRGENLYPFTPYDTVLCCIYFRQLKDDSIVIPLLTRFICSTKTTREAEANETKSSHYFPHYKPKLVPE